MRRAFCCALLLSYVPLHADDSRHHQAWLEFRKAFDSEVGGPVGIYAIQDMVELEAGESAYLSAGGADSARWTVAKTPGNNARVQVRHEGGKALIRGPGIGERDLLQPAGRALTLPNGLAVRATLLREKIAKLWLYNPKLPARKGFKALDYYPYDPDGVITADFQRHEKPVAMSYLDSRQQAGTMYVVGTLRMQIEGKPYALKAYSYRNDWNQIDALLLLLRDRTSGETTYGGGRVVDIHVPKGAPPKSVTFDLNTAYSFLCAHSEYFNCPLVLASTLDVALEFGERYPPLFSGKPHRE
jgi:hypothetical protein